MQLYAEYKAASACNLTVDMRRHVASWLARGCMQLMITCCEGFLPWHILYKVRNLNLLPREWDPTGWPHTTQSVEPNCGGPEALPRQYNHKEQPHPCKCPAPEPRKGAGRTLAQSWRAAANDLGANKQQHSEHAGHMILHTAPEHGDKSNRQASPTKDVSGTPSERTDAVH